MSNPDVQRRAGYFQCQIPMYKIERDIFNVKSRCTKSSWIFSMFDPFVQIPRLVSSRCNFNFPKTIVFILLHYITSNWTMDIRLGMGWKALVLHMKCYPFCSVYAPMKPNVILNTEPGLFIQ